MCSGIIYITKTSLCDKLIKVYSLIRHTMLKQKVLSIVLFLITTQLHAESFSSQNDCEQSMKRPCRFLRCEEVIAGECKGIFKSWAPVEKYLPEAELISVILETTENGESQYISMTGEGKVSFRNQNSAPKEYFTTLDFVSKIKNKLKDSDFYLTKLQAREQKPSFRITASARSGLGEHTVYCYSDNCPNPILELQQLILTLRN